LRRQIGTVARSGIGQLFALLAAASLPFIGRASLQDDDFALWSLLATLGIIGVVIDLGGTYLVGSQMARSHDRKAVLRRAMMLSASSASSVGLLLTLALVAFVSATGLAEVAPAELAAAGLLMSAGGAARGTAAVVAAAALVVRDSNLRNMVLGGQAASQVAITLWLLEAGADYRALPIGFALSSAVAVGIGFLRLRTKHKVFLGAAGPVQMDLNATTRRYARARLSVLVLGLLLTQADRWVLGLVGGASALAMYEVAARVAVIPKLALGAFAPILVSESARRAQEEGQNGLSGQMRRLYRSAFAASAVVTLPLMLGALCVTFLFLPSLPNVGDSRTVTLWAAALLVGHSVHALTMPASMMANGIGRPRAEIPYQVLALAVAASVWALAYSLEATGLAVLAVPVALVIGSCFFLRNRDFLEPTED
jgi:O-antigen/teichoic acid export membrane protein